MIGSEPSCSPAEDAGRVERIRLLNDRFRATFEGGRVMLTEGLKAHAGKQLPVLLLRIRRHDSFDSRSDPYGEHDFGVLEWDGETVIWKIDYYDSDLLGGSPDPSEAAVTTRVLTIMLAREY